MSREHPKSDAVPRSRSALSRIAALVVLATVASYVAYQLGWLDSRHALEHIERLRTSHGVVGFVVMFILIVALGMTVGLPGLPFTVVAGVLFGTLLGTVITWIAAMMGAISGYWVARTVGRDVVVRWLTRFERVDAAIRNAGDFAGILRLRLIPVLPIGAVNFACGLARSPLGAYLGASAIGIIPSTAIYAYFADSLLERVGNGRRDALVSLVVASLLLIAISIAPRFLRSVRTN